MSFTSADYTNRLRQRFLYAAKVMQQTAFSNAEQIYIQLDGNKSGAINYRDSYIDFVDGQNATTLEEQQFYISNSAPQPSQTVPSAPTGLSASAGVTSLTISFTQGSDGGSPITNYEYSIDGGSTFTALSPADTSSPITITGLTANTSYTIALRAVNAIGNSAASNTLTTATVNGPNPPTLTAVLPGDTSVWVYFNPPSGASETNYEYSIDGTTYTAISPADTASPVRIIGLTNGVTYSITLKTVNAVGVSDASNSISVTPVSPSVATSWLNFDPSNSLSYPGSGTTLSNIGSFGTLNGTITSATFNAGVKGGILDFTGSSFVSFGNFNFGNTFSVTAWIFPRATTTINGLLANAGANQSPNGFKIAWNWWMASSRVLYFESGNGTQGSSQNSVQNVITYSAWQHIAYVIDKTNRRVLFFLNGVPVDMGSSVTTTSNFGTNNAAFRIGTFTDGSYGMNAQLGYLRVFNSLLDATQIYADYDNSKTRFLP
jgi:hypothetical protein